MSSSVGIVYDKMTPDVQAQIVRDLMILMGQWELAVYDPSGQVDQGLLDQLYLERTTEPPEVYLVYKTGDDWPETPAGSERVERDLHPDEAEPNLDLDPKVGYYLREQGRDGASLTERYLGRSHPRGFGVTDPLVVMMWS